MRTWALFAFLFILTTPSRADYLVTGPIKADDCWGIGIKICDMVTVEAFEKEGRRYEMPTRFTTVTEVSSKGQCSIRISSGTWATSEWAINKLKGVPTFYQLKDGQLKEISASYLSFPCREMRP